MAPSASARQHLFRTLEGVLGTEDAATLMDHLPPGGWDEVATTTDVRGLGSDLRGEVAGLRGELKGDIAELRGELKGDIADLRSDVAEMRAQMVTRDELPRILDLHLDARMGAIARQWTFANVAMSATMLAAVIAAIRL
jgi:hypothetical protein